MNEDNVGNKNGSEYLRSFANYGTADAAPTGDVPGLLKFLEDRRTALAQGEDEATKKTRERREKRQRLLAGIADGLGSYYNSYARMRGNGMRPIQSKNYTGAVARAQDAAQKARDARQDDFLRYSLMIDKLKKEDRDFNWDVAKQVVAQGNTEAQQAETARANKANEGLRGRALGETERHNKASEDNQAAVLGENKRHNMASETENKRAHMASETLQGKRIAKMAGGDSGYAEFSTGSGMIRVPKSRLNEANIARVFMLTPTEGRPTGTGSLLGGQRLPSKADMLAWIGQNLDFEGVEQALRELQGDGTADAAPTGDSGDDGGDDDGVVDWQPGM